jgi:hypothetical protein
VVANISTIENQPYRLDSAPGRGTPSAASADGRRIVAGLFFDVGPMRSLHALLAPANVDKGVDPSRVDTILNAMARLDPRLFGVLDSEFRSGDPVLVSSAIKQFGDALVHSYRIATGRDLSSDLASIRKLQQGDRATCLFVFGVLVVGWAVFSIAAVESVAAVDAGVLLDQSIALNNNPSLPPAAGISDPSAPTFIGKPNQFSDCNPCQVNQNQFGLLRSPDVNLVWEQFVASLTVRLRATAR